jgi:hypothetical protein
MDSDFIYCFDCAHYKPIARACFFYGAWGWSNQKCAACIGISLEDFVGRWGPLSPKFSTQGAWCLFEKDSFLTQGLDLLIPSHFDICVKKTVRRSRDLSQYDLSRDGVDVSP